MIVCVSVCGIDNYIRYGIFIIFYFESKDVPNLKTSVFFFIWLLVDLCIEYFLFVFRSINI